jgi:hypothetical protein
MQAMKTCKLSNTLLATALVAVCLSPAASFGQGMPADSKEAIHRLFDGHKSIKRDLKLTKKGYEALTESNDPDIARAIKKHVAQMSERLESGLMVRRWDPAFAEYVEHYADIEHEFKPTKKGIRVVVTGKTPAAIKVAQNHAKVLAEFVSKGWGAHDERHPAALTGKADAFVVANPSGKRECCLAGGKAEKPCCRDAKPAGAKRQKVCEACKAKPASTPLTR